MTDRKATDDVAPEATPFATLTPVTPTVVFFDSKSTSFPQNSRTPVTPTVVFFDSKLGASVNNQFLLLQLSSSPV
ncbi:hypothetical protein H5410_063873 [Solanum commersonii]|uniref:Uncharacterized protein n=1 Tax=Solanum commersonii TaxID=4109 RepID=A0A9J5WEE4_SOLCO|nr:hypothetical protein H5410_063873 [Solanum commersonii]